MNRIKCLPSRIQQTVTILLKMVKFFVTVLFSLRFGFCFLLSLTEDSIIWEEEPQLRTLVHQTAHGKEFKSIYLKMIIMKGSRHRTLVLGGIKSRLSKP